MFKKIGMLIKSYFAGLNTPDRPEKSTAAQSGTAKTAVKGNNRSPIPNVHPAKAAIKKPYTDGDEAPKRKRKKKSGNKPVNGNAADSLPVLHVKGIPPMPETLADVPAEEGKTRFSDLDLPRSVQFGIQDLKFNYCTPIQAASLPELLKGRDVCGKAQTGTGKTAAFLLAVFKHLLDNPLPERKNGYCRALVMAPTRELAIQIHKDAESIGKYTGLNNVVVFGGMDHQKQQRELDCPIDVLIGTPGRIIDFSRGRALNLGKTEILVIDEADRMLDMGFIPDVRRIVAQLPHREERQTLLFSATLDDSIMRLAASFLHDPVMLESEPEEIVGHTIDQTFYTVSNAEKLPLLVNLLKKHASERIIIFGNRKCDNLMLQNNLGRYGIKSVLLSGDIAQEKRLKILESFRAGRENVLIATDVAARGIHVDDVSMVINYDLPDRPEDYVHRVGRTGRAGKAGVSLSLLDEYGAYSLPAIEEMLKVQFHSTMPEDDMLVLPEPLANYKAPNVIERRPRTGGMRGGMHGGNRNNGRSSFRGR